MKEITIFLNFIVGGIRDEREDDVREREREAEAPYWFLYILIYM